MQQSEALAILNAGANVFLTGAPGAGKTYVLNEFVRAAREEGANVAVTASTGIAATHINGTTIHSWSGIGLATALTDNLVKTVRTRRKRKLQEADILIIDEVSMLHAWLFDMVDRICRIIRRDERPFGGLQVVLSGDFFQLPPVSVSGRNRDLIAPTPEFIASRERYARAGLNPEGFITESLVWPELNPVICYLTEQHRQDTHSHINEERGKARHRDLPQLAGQPLHQSGGGRRSGRVRDGRRRYGRDRRRLFRRHVANAEIYRERRAAKNKSDYDQDDQQNYRPTAFLFDFRGFVLFQMFHQLPSAESAGLNTAFISSTSTA